MGVFFLSSCRPYSGDYPQRVVYLDIRASQDLNPNMFSEPAPLAITVYSINTLGFSDDMSIDELADGEQGAENTKINRLYQAIIQPGEVFSVKLVVPTDSAAIGVSGEYRDIENARWKSEIKLSDIHQGSWVKRTFISTDLQLYAQFNRLDVTLAERE
ncbi:type VI secretion system lipoprotein TssJ [Tatumella saanichensis]|uniref:type VI secretion system lipoprotein TssJ n=1 Tax=Tatumella saanichensis TaxID=480813 RepID=UPI0004B499FA|nr:type VI secretion system lipoprotein TssJ [Tatumella saanichensis]